MRIDDDRAGAKGAEYRSIGPAVCSVGHLGGIGLPSGGHHQLRRPAANPNPELGRTTTVAPRFTRS